MHDVLDLREFDFGRQPVGGAVPPFFDFARDFALTTLPELPVRGLLHMNNAGGGFAVLIKMIGEALTSEIDLADPRALFDFAYIYSAGGNLLAKKYAAAALGKLVTLYDYGMDTIEVAGPGSPPENPFKSWDPDSDSPLPFTPFVCAGAVFRGHGVKRMAISVSGFTPPQDDWAADMLAGRLALRLDEKPDELPRVELHG